MKTRRWLAWALAAVTVAAGIVASCGIDDEVVWISGDMDSSIVGLPRVKPNQTVYAIGYAAPINRIELSAH